MATAQENERLAGLEVEVAGVKQDVGEIKIDVKSLIAAQTQIAINLAVKEAVDVSGHVARTQAGVWVRFFSERIVAVIALGASVAAFLKG